MEDFNINLFAKKITLVAFMFCLVALSKSDAQRFKGSAVFGLNLSQIDGDDLAGYTKLGWTGGFKLAYPLKEKVDLNVEMLYSQRGSNSGFGFGGSNDIFVDLQYIEIPVYVNIMDWFIEDDDYYKVKAHAGLSYGFLFAVDSQRGLLSDDIDSYNRHNMGYLLGVDYSFNSKFGLNLRYTRSFSSIYTTRAISYFITVRTEYSF